MGAVVIRGLGSADLAPLLALLAAQEVFRPGELAVAREVLEAAQGKGDASGYRCVVADDAGQPVGFACWGETPCTEGTYDLYWIAVDPRWQRQGLASRLLERVLAHAVGADGRLLVVETSDTPAYAAARAFYQSRGFLATARIPGFYRPGDAKVVYIKPLHP